MERVNIAASMRDIKWAIALAKSIIKHPIRAIPLLIGIGLVFFGAQNYEPPRNPMGRKTLLQLNPKRQTPRVQLPPKRRLPAITLALSISPMVYPPERQPLMT